MNIILMNILGWAVLVFAILTAIYVVLSRLIENKNIIAQERIKSLIKEHIKTLSIKWDQSVFQDDYGNFVFDKLHRELDYFIENILLKDEPIAIYLHAFDAKDSLKESAKRILDTKAMISDMIGHFREEQTSNGTNLLIDVDSMSPMQFEQYCAEILRDNGWDTHLTKASGDQGVDVVAYKSGVKVVFQCKKYSQPVGNAAVQEIIAGKQYEKADLGVVVSNNTFTESAKSLAASTGIHLLHYSQLDTFGTT